MTSWHSRGWLVEQGNHLFRVFGLVWAFILAADMAHAQPQASPGELETLAQRLIHGGMVGFQGAPLFPADFRLNPGKSLLPGQTIVISGSLESALGPNEQEVLDALRHETLVAAFHDGWPAGGISFVVQKPDGSHRPLQPEKEMASTAPGPPPRIPSSSKSEALPLGGALLGKRIALSAGHGWLDNGTSWGTQRSNYKWNGCGSCRGIVEDFFTAEIMTQQVIPLLRRMGAELVLMREPDHDPRPAQIVDDGDADYLESGTWNDGSNAGGWGDDYRTNADTDPGSVSYAFDFPEPGKRRVALRFLSGSNRTTAALVTVEGAGLATLFNVDQTRMGAFWMDLGSHYFDGTGGRVELAHGPAAGFLIADAVKIGGGIHGASSKSWTDSPLKGPFWFT
jgi:hypothetical protein